jgi:hypothetical protein
MCKEKSGLGDRFKDSTLPAGAIHNAVAKGSREVAS